MKPGLLSTADVSNILKVNESSVKRWTDRGMLRCIKTPGGHRKYKIKDVVEFMDSNAYDVIDLIIPSKKLMSTVSTSADYAILTKDFSALTDIFYNTVLEGNRENTFQYLNLLSANRISQVDLFDRIIFPAFARIGMKWVTKELGVEQEHLASNTALHAIMKLQDNIAKKPKHGGIALCGCLEYEYHEIGITCVNNVLEAHGWTTLFLGTNLPVKYFVDAIEEHVPDLICVSSTTPKSQKQFVESCALLFETAQIINAKMIVGGFAITDKLIKRIQAGHHSHSIADLMTFVNALPIKK